MIDGCPSLSCHHHGMAALHRAHSTQCHCIVQFSTYTILRCTILYCTKLYNFVQFCNSCHCNIVKNCTIFVFICDFTLVNPVSSEILIVTVFLPWITSINNLTDIPHPFGLLSCCAKALYLGTPGVNTGPLHHENCSLVGDGDVRFILAFGKVDSSSESSLNHPHWQAFLCNELHAP